MMKTYGWMTLAMWLFFGLFSSAAAQDDLNAGLVAHWRFDEGEGNVVQDATENGHSGDNLGANYVESTIGSNIGSGVCTGTALDFGGDDRVRFGSSNDYISDEFTVSAWVFSLNWANQNQPTLIAKGLNQEWMVWKSDDPGRDERFGFRIGLVTVYGTSTVLNNRWYNVVGWYSRSGGRLKIYVNGILEGDVPLSQAMPNESRELNAGVGNRGNASTPDLRNFFRGTIDEIRIYNRALSEPEIVSLYRAFAEPDNDGDCIPRLNDNCPDDENFNQSDIDQDGFGDVCDCSPNDPDVGGPGEDGECPGKCASLMGTHKGQKGFFPLLLLVFSFFLMARFKGQKGAKMIKGSDPNQA